MVGTKAWLKKHGDTPTIIGGGSLAVIVIVGFFLFIGSATPSKEGFNQDNLEGLGFEVVHGDYYYGANVITIDKAGSFVYTARNWDVTLVFLNARNRKVWFTYEGIIYKYQW